jgi:hypothetical protein
LTRKSGFTSTCAPEIRRLTTPPTIPAHWQPGVFDTLLCTAGIRAIETCASLAGSAPMGDVPRGKDIPEPPQEDATYFYRCPACGVWVDSRDLGQVFDHEGPLPHPAQTRTPQ